MKTAIFVIVATTVGAFLYGAAKVSRATADLAVPPDTPSGNSATRFFIAPGRTQCLTRKAIVAPAVLHPVTRVLTTLGARVKKDQPLVKLDDDEPRADVRAKKALLESAEIAACEAARLLARLEDIYARGALPGNRIHDARAAAHKAEKDVLAAKALLDVATAALEHYTVLAPIDGVVNRLEVYPGQVSRPGTTVWGEILNLDEIDVCCQLTLSQVDGVKSGHTVDVFSDDSTKHFGSAKVVFVGLEANHETRKVPVLLRMANATGMLRCHVPVQARFSE